MAIRSLSFTSAVLTGLTLSACFSPSQTPEPGDTEGSTGEATESSTGDTSGLNTGSETENTTTTSGINPATDTGADTSGTETDEGTTASVCGDGVVGEDEACDDAVNDGEYGGCTADCSALAPRCGDGEVSGPEDCDDADEVNGNGCNSNCVVSGSELWTIEGAPAGLCGGFSGGTAVDTENEILVAKMSQCDGDPLIAWLGKYDAGGGLAWSRTWGTGDAGAFGVSTRGTDSVVVGFDGTRGFSRTYDPDGELLNGNFTEPPDGEVSIFYGVAAHEEGFIASGNETTGQGAFLLQGFASDGDLLWTAPDEVSAGGWLDAAVDSAGDGFAVAGWRNNAGQQDMLIRRYSISGDEQWTRAVAGDAGTSDQAGGVAFDFAGNVVVAGTIAGDAEETIWVRKYAADGSTLWTHTSDGEEPGPDLAARVAVDSSGAIVVVGSVRVPDKTSQDTDIWVRKLSPSGTVYWTGTYGGSANLGDTAYSVAIDRDDNVIVTGGVRDGSNSAGDFWMRKYAP